MVPFLFWKYYHLGVSSSIHRTGFESPCPSAPASSTMDCQQWCPRLSVPCMIRSPPQCSTVRWIDTIGLKGAFIFLASNFYHSTSCSQGCSLIYSIPPVPNLALGFLSNNCISLCLLYWQSQLHGETIYMAIHLSSPELVLPTFLLWSTFYLSPNKAVFPAWTHTPWLLKQNNQLQKNGPFCTSLMEPYNQECH